MKLTASYKELSELLLEKTGKDIVLEYGGNAQTVLVRYLHVSCRVRVEQVDAPLVKLSYSVGDTVDPCPPIPSVIGGLFRRGAQALGNRAISVVIENFVKRPAVSVNEDKTLNVDLNKIPQLSKALDIAAVDNITFNEDGASIDFYVK